MVLAPAGTAIVKMRRFLPLGTVSALKAACNSCTELRKLIVSLFDYPNSIRILRSTQVTFMNFDSLESAIHLQQKLECFRQKWRCSDYFNPLHRIVKRTVQR
jgi:hypothetical protein